MPTHKPFWKSFTFWGVALVAAGHLLQGNVPDAMAGLEELLGYVGGFGIGAGLVSPNRKPLSLS